MCGGPRDPRTPGQGQLGSRDVAIPERSWGPSGKCLVRCPPEGLRAWLQERDSGPWGEWVAHSGCAVCGVTV